MSSKAQEFIPYNKPAVVGTEQDYLAQVFERGKFAGNGPMSKCCSEWLKNHFQAQGAYVTTSCTHALEMTALMCNFKPEDEVILPSFSYPSTAAAFARSGAQLVFVDIEPRTMNIDPGAVEAAVTDKTRAIVAVHYAGVSCDMDRLCEISQRHNLILIEDAAQALFSQHHGRALGSIGTFGCLSFHETKNIQCGEGGALIVNDAAYVDRAEIILEKGTNRMKFFRGEVDKYTWVDMGSSYVLSELNCAYLLSQLESGLVLTADRLESWEAYDRLLKPLSEQGMISTPTIPDSSPHNGHIYWIKTKDKGERTSLIEFLKEANIHGVFHFVPLHSSPAGRRYGRLAGEDRFTTSESERLLRLPLYYRFSHTERVANAVKAFYSVLD